MTRVVQIGPRAGARDAPSPLAVQAPPLGAVKLSHSPLVPHGMACCALHGKPVWYGSLHDVYDGSDFDELLLHEADLAELQRRIGAAGPP